MQEDASADQPGMPDPVTTPPLDTSPTTPPLPSKRPWLLIAIVGLVVAIGLGAWFLGRQTPPAKSVVVTTRMTTAKPTTPTAANVQGLQLDTKKNYGNKYASGDLPVGDSKYSASGAKQGYIYACSGYANNLGSSQGGAGSRGPWFEANNTEYNINKKVHVQGSVTWQTSFTNTDASSVRTIITNDLPSHASGVFPIMSSDSAYAYDRNPNTIKGQSLSYTLSDSPTYGSPSCMSGEVGIMLTGVALFNAFDAGGRDAGAWEVQDGCGGHPQREGEYHYHTLSACIKDISVQTVIGYALDGFPITGPQISTTNILSTNDLDECHGLTSQINLGGKQVTTYHYVMTQDFPYSVSCFRGTAIQPPGMKQG